MTDTIAAIATAIAIGQGSIAIVKISGAEALKIIKKISCISSSPSWQTHKILYGWIKDPTLNYFIDEALILIMLAPHSYTKEDVVEVQCHGGIVIAQKILEIIIEQGARKATPGEFTLRAFLNGRLDLSQAEGILTMINAKSERAASLALHSLKGHTSKNIKSIKSQCFEVLSEIEFKIDFEEENPNKTLASIEIKVRALVKQIHIMLEEAANSRIVTTGITVCLLGKPNVGKSSLLNILVKEEKSIVTHIPGTTRDVIEAELVLEGIPIKFIDTAGLQNTQNLVEQIGIVKTQNAAQKADLILLVIDVKQKWNKEEEEIVKKLKDLPIIMIINKIDLEENFNKLLDIPETYRQKIDNFVLTSTINEHGINSLKNAIINLINVKLLKKANSELLLNDRQISNLFNTKESLENVLYSMKSQYPCDLWTIDLRKAISNLEELTGNEVTEIMLNTIFSRFCIGK